MIQMPARIHLFERLFVIKGITSEYILDDRLLMEEIVHHLGCIKPCKSWETLPTSTGFLAGFQPSRVSSCMMPCASSASMLPPDSVMFAAFGCAQSWPIKRPSFRTKRD